ncbi:hypothetical protein JVU11DRAFT_3827 [Chiua virens]|nr:hypothetical protein JVU11DRAFT_3827 [Chiua virens]
MPKVKKKLQCTEKLSFCPDCGKHFLSETNVLRHMNQPSNTCGSLIHDDSPVLDQAQTHQQPVYPNHNASTEATRLFHPNSSPDQFHSQSRSRIDTASDSESGTFYDENHTAGFADFSSDRMHPEFPSSPPPDLDSDLLLNVEYHPNTPQVFPGGKTFMDEFFSDKYGPLRQENLHYPFASWEDWQLGSWLLRSGLSMAVIDKFLWLDLNPIDQDATSFFLLRKEATPTLGDPANRTSLEISFNPPVSPN